jgi:predicted ArsR family transcriptional regulator
MPMRPRSEQPARVLALRILEKNPDGISARDLAEQLGLTKHTVLPYIKDLREEEKVVIVDYQQPKGAGVWSPLYGLKQYRAQQDKPAPKSLSPAERQARYRLAHKTELKARRIRKRKGDQPGAQA